MKIFKLLALASACIFTFACSKPADGPEPVKPEFKLSESNIVVAGLTKDCLVNVDNTAKTVDITVNYADVNELAALKITFKGLADGVTTRYAETFNYSQGSQKVTFTVSGTDFVYTFSASAQEPDPEFSEITVAGQDASSGTVKLASIQDLKKLEVTFKTVPANTVVKVGGNVVASGDSLDFSDKVNGVKFDLTFGSKSSSFTVKAVTTGIQSVTRVWGKYFPHTPSTAGIDDTWFATKLTDALDALRFIAMDNEYIYVSRSQKDADRGAFAIKISDPETVVALDITNVEASGVHHTSSIAVAMDGTKSVVLLCNLVNAKDQVLHVYKYASVTAKAELALSYTLPEAARLGDKMTLEGDWKSGKIWFYDSTSGTRSYWFEIKDGKISQTPVIVDMPNKMGAFAGGIFYPLGQNMYAWAGNAPTTIFKVDGTMAATVITTDTSIFAQPMHGVQMFTINGETYLGYVVLRNNFMDGQFRITAVDPNNMVKSLSEPANPFVFHIGDPEIKDDVTCVKNGNGTGGGCFREIDGRYYYAALVTGTGISLFELK